MSPRIRRIRDWNWEPSDEDFPEAHAARHRTNTGVEECDDESDSLRPSSERRQLYTGYEATTGQSWLSNAAVVASIPDAKLHSTLQRYRDLVRLLEQEITARGHAGADSQQRGRRVPYDAQGASVAHINAGPRRRSGSGRRRTQLTPLQMVEALKMLNKIKESK